MNKFTSVLETTSDEKGRTAVLHAASDSITADAPLKLQRLFKEGANFSIVDTDGFNALQYSCMYGTNYQTTRYAEGRAHKAWLTWWP